MDGSTIMRNLEEQIFGVGTSCIHGRFVPGEIWCEKSGYNSLIIGSRGLGW